MMRCLRCAVETPRLTLTQRYCPTCTRDVERMTAPRPVKGPAWLQRLTPKDMSGALR